MTARKINEEVFKLLWADLNIKTERIAQAMGVTRQAVQWRAKHMGLPSREKNRAMKHDPKLLAEMWDAGVSSAAIAAHFGMADHTSASQAARKMGLRPRVRGPSGYRNGGWLPTITVEEFTQIRLAKAMAAAARSEQAAMINAEMVDRSGSGPVGYNHAQGLV
jgi:hypothetical protein